jgi:transcriptional regulator with XRE-family HTH domain
MGVLASKQGVELLKEAMTKLSVRDNKRWRYQDVADAVNVASKTVERFFRREQAIDEGIARMICALLNVEFADVVEKTKLDSFRQSSGNPFNFGSPVSPDRFYGRRDVLNHIYNRIGARTAQSVLSGYRENDAVSRHRGDV